MCRIGLDGLLASEYQRSMRYTMLIQAIIKHTKDKAEIARYKEALDFVQKFCAAIDKIMDETKRELHLRLVAHKYLTIPSSNYFMFFPLMNSLIIGKNLLVKFRGCH